MDKYFVIGSNSFSGSSLIRRLLDEGKTVYGVSRSPENPKPLLAYGDVSDSRDFTFWQLDVNEDLESLVELLELLKPSHIVNFAAQGMVAESWKAPDDWFNTNVMSLVKLTENLRRMPFIEKYLHFTTPEVYGNTENWLKETFLFAPTTPYAVSRAAGDLHLRSYFLNYGFPVIFTRAANVFGPTQQLYRIVPKTIASILTRRKLMLHGGGFSERSFISMSDTAEAVVALLEKGRLGETYHISTNELISIRTLVKKICSMMDYDFDNLVIDSDERMGKDFAYSLDSEKIRKELGWSEKISLEEGLLQCIDWAKTNQEIIEKSTLNYEHKK